MREFVSQVQETTFKTVPEQILSHITTLILIILQILAQTKIAEF